MSSRWAFQPCMLTLLEGTSNVKPLDDHLFQGKFSTTLSSQHFWYCFFVQPQNIPEAKLLEIRLFHQCYKKHHLQVLSSKPQLHGECHGVWLPRWFVTMGADTQLQSWYSPCLDMSWHVFTVFTLGLGCTTTHTHKHTLQHLLFACSYASYARLLLNVTDFWKETDWSLEKKVWPGSLAFKDVGHQQQCSIQP